MKEIQSGERNAHPPARSSHLLPLSAMLHCNRPDRLGSIRERNRNKKVAVKGISTRLPLESFATLFTMLHCRRPRPSSYRLAVIVAPVLTLDVQTMLIRLEVLFAATFAAFPVRRRRRRRRLRRRFLWLSRGALPWRVLLLRRFGIFTHVRTLQVISWDCHMRLTTHSHLRSFCSDGFAGLIE
jgi:hypothetical protein